MSVSCIYKKKKKKIKEAKLFHIHDCDLKSLVFKMEEKKSYFYCESVEFADSPAHISTCAPSVWYVPLPFERAT